MQVKVTLCRSDLLFAQYSLTGQNRGLKHQSPVAIGKNMTAFLCNINVIYSVQLKLTGVDEDTEIHGVLWKIIYRCVRVYYMHFFISP